MDKIYTILGVIIFLGGTSCDFPTSEYGTLSVTSDSENVIENDTEIETVFESYEHIDEIEDCSAEKQWWVWDLSAMPPSNRQINVTVRGSGKHLFVVVEDDAWGNSVTQGMVDRIINAWDNTTPAVHDKGIFEITTNLFGEPPDQFDDEPRIYLFLYEMESFRGNVFDGYFRNSDQLDEPTSNRHETLHINTLNFAPDSNYMLSVQAHEFQHLIHWNSDRNEVSWLNEAMSQVALVATGFGSDEHLVRRWLKNPNAPIMATEYHVDYGVLLLFGVYLWERFGDDFLMSVVEDTSKGIESLDKQINNIDPSLEFRTVLGDLSLAIAVNDMELENGIFGFDVIEIPEVTPDDFGRIELQGNGRFAFMNTTQNIDHKMLHIETSNHDNLELRVAVIDSNGPTLINAQLEDKITDIELGSWREENTNLWITFAHLSNNSTSVYVRLQ